MGQLTTIESDVLDLLPIGNERKMPLKDISTLLNVNERTIYQVVSNLVKKGVPIVASRNGLERGYYIATNTEELAEGTQAYKEQAKDMVDRIGCLYKIDLNKWRENIKK
ncbi:HTH domain-containing protein [Enterococcus faecalis]|uniref:HTH domain-containing protein n=1 Tax=Enterococcus faecalis TaxID=1351 RepID=UPI0019EAC577|nr:HTH domain-containing protein [Enterococcus faecalis]EGO7832336.1 HTH domain-containing protein [Enterococcus faecalis]EGO8121906.1 HTH domain-containing protein [Enterococcus faecalis]EKK0978269.1 HTH domain-containing protein [Enterococcus faecalis]EKZ0164251.1 HTH domain-containing protein [Enterococcus faecalis]EKZ0220906.1 HTH domain-containing protein [Enterococcus faecalis]